MNLPGTGSSPRANEFLEVVDVESQFGYPIVMLHELLATLDHAPESAMAGMSRIIAAHPQSVAQRAAQQCLADMHFLREEWADALNLTFGFRRLVAFAGLTDVLQPRAQAWEVMRWSHSNITKAGLQNLGAVLDDLQATLDTFHDRHGVSIVGYFWKRVHADEPVDAIAQSLDELVGSDYSVDQIAQLITHGRSVGPYLLTAFEGFAGYEQPIPAVWNNSNPHAFEGLIRALCRPLFRASENRAREAAGLPRVGEGLVRLRGPLHLSKGRWVHTDDAAFTDQLQQHLRDSIARHFHTLRLPSRFPLDQLVTILDSTTPIVAVPLDALTADDTAMQQNLITAGVENAVHVHGNRLLRARFR